MNSGTSCRGSVTAWRRGMWYTAVNWRTIWQCVSPWSCKQWSRNVRGCTGSTSTGQYLSTSGSHRERPLETTETWENLEIWSRILQNTEQQKVLQPTLTSEQQLHPSNARPSKTEHRYSLVTPRSMKQVLLG